MASNILGNMDIPRVIEHAGGLAIKGIIKRVVSRIIRTWVYMGTGDRGKSVHLQQATGGGPP